VASQSLPSDGCMRDYSIFGSCLRSTIAFPELRATADEAPRWTLRVSQRRPALHDVELLGQEDIGDGTEVRLYRSAAGYRLEYDDSTGAFDVSADGRRITWFPAADPDPEMVRLHVIGRVFGTALHASGMYCLHGSGVVLGGGAVGFVAPRFWGKSTLALALTNTCGRLLSDDTLAIQPDEATPRLWPGVHSVRLWGDSVMQVGGQDPAGGAPPFEIKRTLSAFPDQLLARAPAPLSAVYLLAPHSTNGHAPTVDRVRVAPVPAALSLVAHAKIGALLGRSEARHVFDRAVRVASQVPVYRLNFPRDFERIGAVVAQLARWHDGAAQTAAVPA
jgi:hypothetical protein